MLTIDHVNLTMPPGEEPKARAFCVGVLGMIEEQKPPELAGRGGCWFRSGRVFLHYSGEPGFAPQKRAHPAFLVADLEAVARALAAAGHLVRHEESRASNPRFHSEDPFGNRLEFIAAGSGFSETERPMI